MTMSRTALIVDDSTTMRHMVSFTLRQAGFTVLEGEHGRDALARLDGTKIDLIVTDINMPVMDGFAFIQEVRRRPDHRFTPILVLTTEAHEAKKSAGRAAGATGWLIKPFQPEQLLQVIAKVLP
jgi:two-component system chemotaxis response regulator CheY